MLRVVLALLTVFSVTSVAAAQDGEGEGLTPPGPDGTDAPPPQGPLPEPGPPAPPPPPQQAPPPPGYPPVQQPIAPPPAGPVVSADPLVGPGEDPADPRFMDANVDRVILFSTAETHPAGTFYFTDYELILLQFGYAFTDQIQGSVTGVPPLIEDQPYFFDFSLKANLVRGQFKFAVLGSLDVLLNVDDETYWGGRLGGIGTLCFGETCQSSVTAGVGTFLSDGIDRLLPFTFNLGLVGRISNLVAFLVEPVFFGVIGDTTEMASGMMLNYGVRLSGRHWGLDLGLTKIVPFEDDFNDPFILGYPIISFTYRSDWSPRGGAVAPPPMTGASSSPSAADLTRRALTGF